MHGYVLHNRDLRESRERVLLPGQVGYLNGWGVFSTLRVCRGVLFAFERHYARMQRDAKLMRVPFSIPARELEDRLLALVERNAAFDAVLRVACIRNRGGLFEAPGLKEDADLVAFTAPITDWGQDVRLTYVANARFGASPFSGTKVTSWAQNLAWYERAREQGADEALLLNEHGQVSECTSANIFAIQGTNVWTPPLATSGCLPGVTRAILLEEVRVEGLEIGERELSPVELEQSDGLFITSTTRDLLPVRTIDGQPIRQNDGVLRRLREVFLARREAYITKAHAERPLVHS